MMTFIEHPVFTRRIEELVGLEQYRQFQRFLAQNPEAGDVIPGMGGLRKVRLALPGHGKRGGARVLYLLFMRAEKIYFVYVYTKGEFEDIPTEKRRIIMQLICEIRKEIEL
jgi:hypothetical protein